MIDLKAQNSVNSFMVLNTFPQAGQTTAKGSAVELAKDSVKGSVPRSSVPPLDSDCTEPMDTDNDTPKDKDHEASTAKIKDKKSSSLKSTTSDPSKSCPPSSRPASRSSCVDLKQEKGCIEGGIKDEEKKKDDVKKGSPKVVKTDLDSVKIESKTEKMEVSQTTKPSRPSSTPPSDAGMVERAWMSYRINLINIQRKSNHDQPHLTYPKFLQP